MQKTETKSVKTEQPVKMNFFEALTALKSKNFELMKDSDIHKDHRQKGSDFLNNLVNLGFSYSGQQKSVSAQQSTLSKTLTLEATLGTTMRENKDTKELLQK